METVEENYPEPTLMEKLVELKSLLQEIVDAWDYGEYEISKTIEKAREMLK